jgi:hypothetical protein
MLTLGDGNSVHQLEFETLHTYGTQKTSIELDVTLRFGERDSS